MRLSSSVVLTVMVPVLSLALSAGAASKESEAASRALRVARDEAKALSVKGDYAAAAERLRKSRGELAKDLSEYERKDLDGDVAIYESRATWSRSAATSVPAARALLASLLLTKGQGVEKAQPSDARVAQLLASLRKNDPPFAKVFVAGRTVHLKVTANPKLVPEVTEVFVREATGSLKHLGFEVSTEKGEDVLEVTIDPQDRVDLSKDEAMAAFMGGAASAGGSTSCGADIEVTWKRGEERLFNRLDLTTRDLAFSETGCEAAPAKKAAKSLAHKVLEAHLGAYAKEK